MKFDMLAHWRPGSESRIYLKRHTEKRPELWEIYDRIIRELDAKRGMSKFKRELAAKMEPPAEENAKGLGLLGWLKGKV